MRTILAGDPGRFAVECQITAVNESLSWLGLGCFLIHIGGKQFGIREPDATMLGCSFNALERRISRRGLHLAPNLADAEAFDLAAAVNLAIYGDPGPSWSFRDKSAEEISREVRGNKILWAPDGDEAFDDGSRVLQFDIGDRVRVLGFRSDENHLPVSVADVQFDTDAFYSILEDWRSRFESARHEMLLR